jgi:hypothetical protein
MVIALTLLAASCGPAGAPAVVPTAATPSMPTTTPSLPPRLALVVPIEGPTLRTTMVSPQDTDPAIGAPNDPHLVVFDPAATPRRQLFVFLGGQGAAPSLASLIVRQAAANGFHAIGLSYPNAATREICETKLTEPDCYEKARLETLDGVDRTPLITVAPANAIQARLTKLLAHLAVLYPGDGWSAYLDAGAPKWSLLRLGGVSEGGSHVALIAREHEVARLCMLESPVDLIGAPTAQQRTPPTWISPAKATPVDRYYGLRHVRSSSPQAPAFAAVWSTFGMDRFGPPVDVDSATPPYGGSHHLTTGLKPVDDGRPNLEHRAIAGDRTTPRTVEGKPALAPAWQYACMS